MKRFATLLTILSLTFSIRLFATESPVASITFSNPVAENNISLVLNANQNSEAFTEFVKLDTMDCLHIPTDKYAYFRVDDAILSEYDNNLIIHITYFNEGYGSVAIQYNAIQPTIQITTGKVSKKQAQTPGLQQH